MLDSFERRTGNASETNIDEFSDLQVAMPCISPKHTLDITNTHPLSDGSQPGLHHLHHDLPYRLENAGKRSVGPVRR